MGSSPIVGSNGGSTDKTHGFRNRWWRVNDIGGGASSTVHCLFVSFLLCSSVGVFYIFYLFNNPNLDYNNSLGCQEDNEGSWGIGVFYGDSPFSLKPIEDMNIWDNKTAAWPVANPILTCASITDSGFPSNFVADPFLYSQGDILYLFFETKNPITMQGDIGVARSNDDGATWEQLGVALDEDWHLSHPYVFDYNRQIYMMPDGGERGDTRLYRAVGFPLQWKLEKIILERPLVDAFIIQHGENYWIFGSDPSRGTNGGFEIWYSSTPFGPWTPHRKNPISGVRNGGRPFSYNGNLYRLGHDENVLVFKIEVLTTDSYKEVRVDLGMEKPTKGKNAWNGARSHHLDVQGLRTGQWIAVADGDRTLFGDVTSRRVIGCSLILAAGLLVFFVGLLFGFVKCFFPLTHNIKRRNDALLVWERLKLRLRWNQVSSFLRGKINPTTFVGKFVFTILLIATIAIISVGFGYIYGGNGAEKPYPVNDHFSQFTLLAMTYDARMWNLKMYIKHYSRCASVREILVVWNKGKPPDPSEFNSMVPVRIRVEEQNSLNNRFRIDPLIKTKAVLELDDDIMMNCDDLERGFKIWRETPERLVGFYPRLVTGPPPLKYRPEKHARSHNGYNMILTGAVFIDRQEAFERYWSKEAEPGRKMVDEVFNCEDVLMNFLYANATPSGPSVEYIKPAWAIDTSKFSGVAISGNTQAHYRVRSRCLERFTELYGGLTDRKVEFGRRKDGWDQ
ncbi:glycosyltransferase family protein 64 protein C5-like isoform X1 [Cynara cardunculus var. scolymus]|uniref:Glucosamine inositolphosphorylceramide transferase 1 n=2 Tax=Cynara cardunculus var. scolymus TaxID=59895 RepID=A0A103Y9L6_CYNCS|nr:glycosyltransferase family protein 64 protein C5-like isoform X1 [Cynara cardunculus var. scolymus]KVI05051.1 EXTL2, alpha-1,4-N-acetylhexosaminyltransferase [Cynara cardunculus var. scolymus]